MVNLPNFFVILTNTKRHGFPSSESVRKAFSPLSEHHAFLAFRKNVAQTDLSVFAAFFEPFMPIRRTCLLALLCGTFALFLCKM
jgi:hypothetical protein